MEGLDGSGKTTQIKLLRSRLEQDGYEVVETREPGGTPIGDKIRELLLDPGNHAMTAKTEALLYSASRAQHTEELIRPALLRGAVVISDRYTDSTMIYQGIARGLSWVDLSWTNQFATDNLDPDLTLLLDGKPEKMESRLAKRGNKDRLDSAGLEFHQKVQKGYLAFAASQSDRIKVIDANRSVKKVWADVDACVTEFLTKRGR